MYCLHGHGFLKCCLEFFSWNININFSYINTSRKSLYWYIRAFGEVGILKANGGCRARSEPGGTRWRIEGEVKGKLANGLGSQYSHATSERRLFGITQADAHTSVASSRLNWRPHRFKWTGPFRGKTKSDFCACAITFRTSYTGRTLTGETLCGGMPALLVTVKNICLWIDSQNISSDFN